MMFAIGRPDHPVRIYLHGGTLDDALVQCDLGEVAFEVSEPTPGVIRARGDGWGLDPLPPDPVMIAAAQRGERDRRLAACDWTQLPDAPLTPEQRAAWADYRQALRDLPAHQAGAPLEQTTWPQEPTHG